MVLLKSDTNYGTFKIKTHIYIYITIYTQFLKYLFGFSFQEIFIRQSCRKNRKTFCKLNIFPENRAVSEMM